MSPNTDATPEAKTKAESKTSSGKVDKFAEARLAKKKQRRKAHRATIKRSEYGRVKIQFCYGAERGTRAPMSRLSPADFKLRR